MDISTTELHRQTRDVIDAVRAGATVTIRHYNRAVALITPYRQEDHDMTNYHRLVDAAAEMADAPVIEETTEITYCSHCPTGGPHWQLLLACDIMIQPQHADGQPIRTSYCRGYLAEAWLVSFMHHYAGLAGIPVPAEVADVVEAQYTVLAASKALDVAGAIRDGLRSAMFHHQSPGKPLVPARRFPER